MILSLFDKSAVMLEPWLEAGHTCVQVDLQHEEGEWSKRPNLITIGADLDTWTPPDWWDIDMVFAFPPCTDLASSGARWWKAKGPEALDKALNLVGAAEAIGRNSGAPWMIENPVGRLSTYWGKPDYYFDPYEYGGYKGGENDGYTKRTCLWTGNGFVMPEPKPIPVTDGSRMHRLPPSPERANLRSLTPRGFAQAVYEANTTEITL